MMSRYKCIACGKEERIIHSSGARPNTIVCEECGESCEHQFPLPAKTSGQWGDYGKSAMKGGV